MGMYDQDPNFEDHFEVGDRLIVMAMEYVGTISTRYGDAQKTRVQIVSREHPTTKRWYSVLGAGFANLAQRAERSDFPHVAEYVRVDLGGGKDVKRFAKVDVQPRAFLGGEDGPPVDLDPLTPTRPDAGHSEDDDIPF